jgi:exopolyphosphatase/guanosine-5'-triphosphate,3'-diphosphate pyrophosphatase
MNKIYPYIIASLLCFALHLQAEIERRAVLDIGSGGTKVAIADVDNESHLIADVHFEQSFPVPYQASLDKSFDGTFDEETQKSGLDTFQKIKEIADQYQVQKITAVATSAFRKANNAQDFVKKVFLAADIQIKIISQREEGIIAFNSALASGGFDPNELIVWDIGTGRMQITVVNENQDYSVYMGEQMGSVAFKSHIMDVIQDKDDDELSPNPISEEDLKMADRYARAFARKAYPIIKDKIYHRATIAGIGRLFYHSIRPLAAVDNVITRKGLRDYIVQSLNKSDEDLDNPYADLDVTNCILALAVMKALHIHEILPVETTTTRGILVSPSYWAE